MQPINCGRPNIWSFGTWKILNLYSSSWGVAYSFPYLALKAWNSCRVVVAAVARPKMAARSSWLYFIFLSRRPAGDRRIFGWSSPICKKNPVFLYLCFCKLSFLDKFSKYTHIIYIHDVWMASIRIFFTLFYFGNIWSKFSNYSLKCASFEIFF